METPNKCINLIFQLFLRNRQKQPKILLLDSPGRDELFLNVIDKITMVAYTPIRQNMAILLHGDLKLHRSSVQAFLNARKYASISCLYLTNSCYLLTYT